MIPSAYRGIEVIVDSPQRRVVRGYRVVDGMPVIIKSVRSTDDALARERLQNHLRISAGLHIRGIPSIVDALDAADGYIIMQDAGSKTLSSVIASGPCSLETFLSIATDVSRVLAELHDARILHRDIAPQNIVIDDRSSSVSIIDLGLSLRLDADGTASVDRSTGGTMHYMSPEQTGRMNRRIDVRSDLYGLGAVFFALLTGRPPFLSDDVSVVLHAHIARRAPRVRDIVGNVPFAIDELINVLLRKDPEERYASARVLHEDLTALQTAVADKQPMPLLRGITSTRRLQWPSIMVGRDSLVDQLVPNKVGVRLPRLIAVRGETGVGKSSIVRAATDRARGLGFQIGRGSYTRLDRGQPASAITAALTEALSFLEHLDASDVPWWRAHFSKRLHGAESIAAANLPALRPYLDHIAPVPELAPLDAQARSLRTMELLAGAVAPARSPMVLVLEDLQWADTFSINLLERVLRSEEDHALSLICTIRDGDPASEDVLRVLTAMAADHAVTMDTIVVPPLDLSTVSEILSASIGSRPPLLEQASLLLHRATGGNALTLRETIRHCGRSGVIRFDAAADEWIIDVDGIARLVMTDSSSAYQTEYVRMLSEDLRQTLIVCACLGSSIHLSDLADVRAVSREIVATHCSILAREGLLYHREDEWYNLINDRIADAACTDLHSDDIAAIHQRIADSIARRVTGRNQEERIFELVHHGNAARAKLSTDADRFGLASRNILAARISRQSAAFEACAQYAAMARTLIDECRSTDVELYHEATLLLAECRAMQGDPGHARTIIDDALRVTVDTLHRADLFSTRMALETVAGDMPTAIRNGLFALRELGIVLPSKPSNLHVLRSLIRARLALRMRRPHDLLNHSPLQDERARRALRILDDLSTSAYHESTIMIAVAGLERARVAFTYGFDGESIDAVAFYAMILTLMGFKRLGSRFADVAEHLAERGAHPRTHGRTLFVLGATTTIWTRSGTDTLGIIRRAAEASTRASDGQYVGYSMGHEIQNLLIQGCPINEILDYAEQRWRVVRQLFPTDKQPPLIVSLFRTQTLRMAAGLQGSARLCDDLAGPDFNPVEHVEALTKSRTTAGLCEWYWKLLLVSILANDHDYAQTVNERLRRWEFATAGQPFSIDIAFLRCLLAARMSDSSSLKKHSSIVRKAAAHSPAFKSRARIIDGLQLLLRDDTANARVALLDALAKAQAERNLLLAGFASEWLAILCDRISMPDAAHAYRELACSAFGGFGATVAVDRLRGSHITQADAWQEPHSTSLRDSSEIDYELVLRASASIASEIRLDGLTKTLLTLVLQHAGAQRAILFTQSDDAMRVTAMSDDDGSMSVGSDVRSRPVPYVRSVLDRAMSSNEPVIEQDASASDLFSVDPDVVERSVRSVMALPIIHSSTSPGALYLENNLVSNAFTSERVGILRLLGGHIAVALENARLYDAQQRLLDATARFVPSEFLHHLGERSINDISSGMAVRLPMTILFADIRRFTTISESLPTDETFTFLNDYLGLVEPIIRRNAGFIDKYIGDAVMSLFPGEPSQAVQAAIDIQRALLAFNQERDSAARPRLSVGIGIHYGEVILGTVGSIDRMDTTVIGDAVNVASRLEQLTKDHGLGIIISDEVRRRCAEQDTGFTAIGSTEIRGRSQPIIAYAVDV